MSPPQVFDDSLAREEWGWKHSIGLEQLVDIMISNLRYVIIIISGRPRRTVSDFVSQARLQEVEMDEGHQRPTVISVIL